MVAAVATLVAFGGIVTVTQVSNASTDSQQKKAMAACNSLKAPAVTKKSTETKRGSYTTNNGKVTHHADDGQVVSEAELRKACRAEVTNAVKVGNSTTADGDNNNRGNNNGGGNNNNGGNNGGEVSVEPGAGLGVLANSCEGSRLEPHTGFQLPNKCISTEFGELGEEAKNPTLLIVEAPEQVQRNQPFEIKVSTRNLVRDRFLGAAAGGYYVESSLLNGQGLLRGHFHSACRILDRTDEAPRPEEVPEFFVATEDKRGGQQPDVVTIQVPGLPDDGEYQCSSWAGDGSHRIPMMVRANQTPAFDSIRVQVGGGGGNNNNGNNGGNNNGGNNNGGNNNGGGNNTNVKTVKCPAVANQVGNVPNSARGEVDRELKNLENQVNEANGRLAANGNEGGGQFVQNAVLNPLKDKRGASIDRISLAIQRAGGQAPNLGGLATCTA